MKKIIFFVTLFIFSMTAFAQESENIKFLGNKFTKPQNFSEFINLLDFEIEAGPGMYINTESKTVSAPSPIIYPVTMGFLWPNNTFLAVQPSMSFFMMNHLWYNNKALPAEIENRTSTTLSFMFTIPAVISIYMGKTRLQLMPGISILTRFAFLANNINADDSGFSGSAASDIANINGWFWNNARFFYLSSGVSFLYNIYNDIKIGPVINLHIPLVPLVTGEGLQGTIISIGMKISL